MALVYGNWFLNKTDLQFLSQMVLLISQRYIKMDFLIAQCNSMYNVRNAPQSWNIT
jgi:hypothetical protein